MNPPSTLRLSGLAAAAVALVLMGANRTEHRVVRHEAPTARFEYAVAQLAQARAELAAAQVERAGAIAMAWDSVAGSARLAPKIRVVRHQHQPPVIPETPESPAAGR